MLRVNGPAQVLGAESAIIARRAIQPEVETHKLLKTCHAQDFLLFVGWQVLKFVHRLAKKMPAQGGRTRNYGSNFQYGSYCPMYQHFVF